MEFTKGLSCPLQNALLKLHLKKNDNDHNNNNNHSDNNNNKTNSSQPEQDRLLPLEIFQFSREAMPVLADLRPHEQQHLETYWSTLRRDRIQRLPLATRIAEMTELQSILAELDISVIIPFNRRGRITPYMDFSMEKNMSIEFR